VVSGKQRVPTRTPDHLDDIPAGSAECRLEFLDDFSVAANRAVETLQITVHDENQVVETFPHRHRDGAHGLWLVHLAVAEKTPDLAVARCNHLAMLEIPHETCLVNRHHRTEAHRHGRKLPELRHQPGVRIRRKPAATDFLTKPVELALIQPPFEKGSRVNTGR